MRRPPKVPATLALLAAGLLALGTLGRARSAWACAVYNTGSYCCCENPVAGTNPSVAQWNTDFEQGASGQVGPGLPKIGDGTGASETQVPCTVPCNIMKAIGIIESGWTQFRNGQTLIAFDCGYGATQVTSGMTGDSCCTGCFDPARIADDPAYNIGAGAGILCDKWIPTPTVGGNDPNVVEDWYYAIWAYNGLVYQNNPNNPAFPAWPRPPYNCAGGYSYGSYPYQERVYGEVACPQNGWWAGEAVTLPDPSWVGSCGSGSCPNIPQPTPSHTNPCAGPQPCGTAAGTGSGFASLFTACYSLNGGQGAVGCATDSAHGWGQSGVVLQDFAGGSDGTGAITDAQAAGATRAFYVHGAIWAHYLQLGGAPGAFGAATSDETAAGQSPAGTNGRFNDFVQGQIVWSPALGAQGVLHPLREKYDALGGTVGVCGFPANDTSPAAASPTGTTGRYNSFEGCDLVAWDSGANAGQVYAATGALRQKYDSLGGTGSPCGFPLADTAAAGSSPAGTTGDFSPFERCEIDGWTSGALKGKAFAVQSPLREKFDLLQGTPGPCGFPENDTSPATPSPAGTTGAFNAFEGCEIDAPASGAGKGQAFAVVGPMRSAFGAFKGTGGPLGFPSADAKAGPTSSQGSSNQLQPFEGGELYLATSGSHAGAAFAAVGPVAQLYSSTGGPKGPLGLPVADGAAAGVSPFGTTGTAQGFEAGEIDLWGSGAFKDQAFALHGAVWKLWSGLGGTAGKPLGFPVANLTQFQGHDIGLFEGGCVGFDPTSASYQLYSGGLNRCGSCGPASVSCVAPDAGMAPSDGGSAGAPEDGGALTAKATVKGGCACGALGADATFGWILALLTLGLRRRPRWL